MKKLITTLAGTGLLMSSLALVGCGEKTELKQEEKVTTPGGSRTETKTTTVKERGENPPPAGTQTPPSPK